MLEELKNDDYWCTERLDIIKDICDEVVDRIFKKDV